ncbi:hypothetical protein [Glycomyces sp. YM15]|uniref:hypothetical protein n=1 Tax=Glycomyces sp. YM15 TaxID=2800446 RepID=UPI001962F143|nr:hypothetical protein [Glycomyces sp. YM15]
MTSIRLRGTPEDNQRVHDHLADAFTIVKSSADLKRRNRDGSEFWDRYLVVGLPDTDTDESAT